MMGMEYEILLGRIMKSDPNIRHCIIADSDGNIKATKHKDGVDNYLSQVETAASLKRAASSWKARKQLTPKIGPGNMLLQRLKNLRG